MSVGSLVGDRISASLGFRRAAATSTGGRCHALSLAVLFVIAACGPGAATRHDLPTWCNGGPCLGVPADIPRTATIHGSSSCIWLEIEGQRSAILWPAHYTAELQPLIVYDDSGNEMAKEGDVLATVMLGPIQTDRDACGLTSTVQLYFDKFSDPTPSS
jgi:hypothetical protein